MTRAIYGVGAEQGESMKLDRLAISIAAIAVVSTALVISFRNTESITTAILIATFVALAVPVVWSTSTSRGAYQKMIGFAGISVYFGEVFLAEMMKSPGFRPILRWGILFAGNGLLAVLYSRERPPAPKGKDRTDQSSTRSFEPISKSHVP
jgi:hypothetical protein